MSTYKFLDQINFPLDLKKVHESESPIPNTKKNEKVYSKSIMLQTKLVRR